MIIGSLFGEIVFFGSSLTKKKNTLAWEDDEFSCGKKNEFELLGGHPGEDVWWTIGSAD